MTWITRKVRNYIWPALLFSYNSILYFFTIKKVNSCILLASFDEYGGTRTYFEQLCKFLREKNKRVICLVTEKQRDTSFLELMHQLGFKSEVIPDREYVIEYSGKWSLKLYSYYLNKLLSDLNLFISYCRKYQAASFFISSGEPEKWLYLIWLPVRKMFYVLHTLPYRNIGRIGSYILQRKLSVKKRMITVSDFSRRTMVRYWRLSEEQMQFVKVVYNFFEPSLTSYLKDTETKIRILTLGHVVSYKDPFLWIDVAESVLASMSHVNLEFIWAGEGTLLDECRNKVINNPSIQFLGFIKNVNDFYRCSDIYFQPSLLESHGISVIGAMYFGLPCIVSDAGGLPESVESGKNGFVVDKKNSIEYSKHIICLINDSKKRKEMGEQGKRIFDKKFSKIIWSKKMNEFV